MLKPRLEKGLSLDRHPVFVTRRSSCRRSCPAMLPARVLWYIITDLVLITWAVGQGGALQYLVHGVRSTA